MKYPRLAHRLGLVFVAALACEPPPAVAPANATPPPPPVAAPAPVPGPPVVDRELLRVMADTRGFTRGSPSRATVTPDGRAVLFLRSAPTDTKQSLYEMDVATGAVRQVLTPESLDQGPEHLSAEERARRERMRVTASGFTGFELSRDGATVLVTLSGRLYALDRAGGRGRAIDTGKGAVLDPHLSPDGKLVAFVEDDDVRVVSVQGAGAKPRAITHGGTEDHPHGLADFAASEELARYRGFWWSPDSRSILFEDSDASALPRFVIADPGRPETPATRVPYPRAGTANAVLRFGIASASGTGAVTWIDWDRAAMPYVPGVFWNEGAPPCLVTLDRLQKNEAMLVVDVKTGKTREAMHEHDDAWVNGDGGGYSSSASARWLPDGSAFLWWSERDGDGRLGLVPAHDPSGVKWLTPAGTQVIALLDLDAKRRVAIVETTRDALHFEVDAVPLDGGPITTVAKRDDGSVHGRFDGTHDFFVATETSLEGMPSVAVRSVDGRLTREVPTVAIVPPTSSMPHYELADVGPDRVHVAIVRPRSYVAGARYPLIDDAYAGPHARVVAPDASRMLMAQWMADATGAIVVAMDTKGTPSRGRAWERAIAGKLGQVPLDGHVATIRALAATHPEIDGSRVGVYGWSFGGYFAALAALLRPDVYSAAVAGAPVTDWRNYDTAYTERYMGLPDANAAAYDSQSAIVAARAVRPDHEASLLVIQGTADDNVYFFNSLQLVDALAKAGRSFRFMPLLGQTHQVASPDANFTRWLATAEALSRGLAR